MSWGRRVPRGLATPYITLEPGSSVGNVYGPNMHADGIRNSNQILHIDKLDAKKINGK